MERCVVRKWGLPPALDKCHAVFCWPGPVLWYDAVPLVFWGFFLLVLELQLWGQKQDPGFWVLQGKDWALVPGELSFFLCSFVSQSPGAVRTWMEHGGFPGGSWSLFPLPRRVCVVNMERQGTSFVWDVSCGRGKSQESSREGTFLQSAVGHSLLHGCASQGWSVIIHCLIYVHCLLSCLFHTLKNAKIMNVNTWLGFS